MVGDWSPGGCTLATAQGEVCLQEAHTIRPRGIKPVDGTGFAGLSGHAGAAAAAHLKYRAKGSLWGSGVTVRVKALDKLQGHMGGLLVWDTLSAIAYWTRVELG